LSYSEVKSSHPELISILVGKIRSSNSKDKNKSEKDYEWSYSYGVAVKGMSFDEMISEMHIGKKKEVEPEKSFSEMINSKLNSVIGLSLTISAGRTKRYVALTDKPKLFVEKFSAVYQKGIEDMENEQARISKLTPDEREREVQEHINELSDMGGFVGMNISSDGITQITPKEIDYNVDDILDKISRVGVEGLTAGEKKFLEQK
jgi:hypothetical protein